MVAFIVGLVWFGGWVLIIRENLRIDARAVGTVGGVLRTY